MASPILGIEYSTDGIRVVEASPGRTLGVRNFALIDVGALPSLVSERLAEVFSREKFHARQALIALSGPGITHRLLQLPSLESDEIDSAVASGLRQAGPSGNLAWDYSKVTHNQGGMQRNQLLLATADAEILETLREIFSRLGLKILRVTTAADALVHMMGKMVPRNGAVRCVVHLCGARCAFVFALGKQLLQSRDIQIDFGEPSTDELRARLIHELRRSILSLEQDRPELNVDEILFSGETPLDWLPAIQDELGLACEPFRMEEIIDTEALLRDENAFRSDLARLSVALAAAWEEPDSGIDLNMQRTDSRPRSTAFAGLAKILLPVTVGLVAIAAVYSYATSARAAERIARLEARRAELESVLSRTEGLQRLRERQTVVGQLVDARVDWTEVFRNLSLALPESAALEDVSLDRLEQTRMVIRGSIVGSNSTTRTDFETLLERLRRIPGVLGVRSAMPSSQPFGRQSRLRFEVECELT